MSNIKEWLTALSTSTTTFQASIASYIGVMAGWLPSMVLFLTFISLIYVIQVHRLNKKKMILDIEKLEREKAQANN